MDNTNFIKQIRKCIESQSGKKIKFKETAKDIGVTSTTLSNFFNGKSDPRFTSIFKIMRYAGCMIKCKENNYRKWSNCMNSSYMFGKAPQQDDESNLP